MITGWTPTETISCPRKQSTYCWCERGELKTEDCWVFGEYLSSETAVAQDTSCPAEVDFKLMSETPQPPWVPEYGDYD